MAFLMTKDDLEAVSKETANNIANNIRDNMSALNLPITAELETYLQTELIDGQLGIDFTALLGDINKLIEDLLSIFNTEGLEMSENMAKAFSWAPDNQESIEKARTRAAQDATESIQYTDTTPIHVSESEPPETTGVSSDMSTKYGSVKGSTSNNNVWSKNDSSDNSFEWCHGPSGTYIKVNEQGDVVVNITGNLKFTVGSSANISFVGNTDVGLGANLSTLLMGNNTLKIQGTTTSTITGASSTTYEDTNTITSTGALTIEGQADMDIQAGGTTNIKGSTINLN